MQQTATQTNHTLPVSRFIPHTLLRNKMDTVQTNSHKNIKTTNTSKSNKLLAEKQHAVISDRNHIYRLW